MLFAINKPFTTDVKAATVSCDVEHMPELAKYSNQTFRTKQRLILVLELEFLQGLSNVILVDYYENHD